MDRAANDVWSKGTHASGSAELVLIAEALIAARCALRGPLPSDPLHDPVLDLLLGAYVADVEGRSPGIGSFMAATTFAIPLAARWAAVFVSRELIGERTGEVFPTSNRRTVIDKMQSAVSRSQAAI